MRLCSDHRAIMLSCQLSYSCVGRHDALPALQVRVNETEQGVLQTACRCAVALMPVGYGSNRGDLDKTVTYNFYM